MKKVLLFISGLLISVSIHAQNQVITQGSVSDQASYIVPVNTDLHLTDAEDPIVNSTISINSEDSWLFFDKMKPLIVLEKYKSNILINGQALEEDINCRISVYGHGTVIMSHTDAYKPLQVFTEQNYGGEGTWMSLYEYHNNLPAGLENKIRSFKLKRGYMATLANSPDGTGYSRVFVADREDINIPVIQSELDQTISYIRVFRWEWVSKKGWCGGSYNQRHLTNSTWYYDWGAGKNSEMGMEYVPERITQWWPGFETDINPLNKVSHLLSFNEPDHWEQANMSVDIAIEQWPQMMKSGLRVGSPATTDFKWLYEFMEKANARNYRVDYVVIHAYWGETDPQRWYNSIAEVHRKTKRPIWIKEWNIGAHWTGEWWPNRTGGPEGSDGGGPNDNTGPADNANQTYMRDNLKRILNVMDTCSFIERYSIYNWVGYNRAILIKSEKDEPEETFTLAGELYRDNVAPLAYNPDYEVIPQWDLIAPVLSYTYDPVKEEISLSWSDSNQELSRSYNILKKVNNGKYEKIDEITNTSTKKYTSKLNASDPGKVSYAIQLIGYNGETSASNEIDIFFTPEGKIQYDNVSIKPTDWKKFYFGSIFEENPLVIFGPSSYVNKDAMTNRIKSLTKEGFDFQLNKWNYVTTSTFRDETISYFAIPAGSHQFGNIQAQAASASVTSVWKAVNFSTAFETVPIVFTTQTTNNSSFPQTVRIRNVTKTGFEVALQKEEKVTATSPREYFSYVALTPGTGTINGKKIVVGITPDNTVGSYAKQYQFSFNEDSFINPAFFAGMQTTNDNITSTLRYSALTGTNARIFKQREVSAGASATVQPEQVGWMVIEIDQNTSISSNKISGDIQIYPNPATEILYISGIDQNSANIEIFNLLGNKVISQTGGNSFDVSGLSSGFYILLINGKQSGSFIKK